MKSIPRIAGAAAAVLALTTVTACSSSSAPGSGSESWSIPTTDPTATVTVVSIAGLGKDTDGMQAVVDAFEKAHPTITIDWQTVPGDQLSNVIESRMGNKDANLDLFWADQPRIAALAQRGYLEDITSQFEAYASSWQKPAYIGSTANGKLYGVPLATSTQLLYYNKALLSKAGVPAPSSDPDTRMTWQDLKTAAQKVQSQAGAQYGLTFGQVNTYYQLEPLPVSAGGSAGATGTDNLTPDITSDAWVSAMNYYGSLFADGVAPRGVTDNDSDFLAGKTAFLVEGNWMLDRLAAQTDVDWGVAAHPVWAGGTAVTPTGGWDLAMSPFSTQKEAAAIFMKWMTVDDGGNYSRYRPAPELPANNDGLTSYLEKPLFQTEEGAKAASLITYESDKTGFPRVQTVGYLEFESIIGQTFSDIANGADAKKALDDATASLKTAWAKYNKG